MQTLLQNSNDNPSLTLEQSQQQSNNNDSNSEASYNNNRDYEPSVKLEKLSSEIDMQPSSSKNTATSTGWGFLRVILLRNVHFFS